MSLNDPPRGSSSGFVLPIVLILNTCSLLLAHALLVVVGEEGRAIRAEWALLADRLAGEGLVREWIAGGGYAPPSMVLASTLPGGRTYELRVIPLSVGSADPVEAEGGVLLLEAYRIALSGGRARRVAARLVIRDVDGVVRPLPVGSWLRP